MSEFPRSWYPYRRTGLRYVVQRCTYSNWAGAWYEFAKENGKVMRFWTAKGAQAFADELNAKEKP